MQGFFPTHGLTHEKALHGGYRFSLSVLSIGLMIDLQIIR
jgi:hypothetical protein